MAEIDLYENKFKEMQKYLPFLQKMITKLKASSNNQLSENPRKAHLQKMEMLFDLLTNKDKKLKMETLLKCENVLIKLQTKIEKGAVFQSDLAATKEKTKVLSKDEIFDLTGPESPPPLEKNDEESTLPVEIPTERRCSPVVINEVNLSHRHHSSTFEKGRVLYKSRDQDHRYNFHQQQKLPHSGNRMEPNKVHHHRREHHRRRDETCSLKSYGYGLQKHKVATTESLHFNIANRNFPSTTNYSKYANLEKFPKAFKRNEVYSPEQLWDDYSKNQSVSPRNRYSMGHKWVNSDGYKRALSCHGRKEDDDHILGKTSSGLSGPMSIPARVTPIPEVLKSPPLSASDINNLLNETSDDALNDSISEIGTRRSVKPESHNVNVNVNSNTIASSLDFVRKKFAMITKIKAANVNTSPIRSDISESPASPLPPLPNERIALKYNPHPRAEHDHAASLIESYHQTYPSNKHTIKDTKMNAGITSVTTPQITNANVLPTINLNDPRLRRSNITTRPDVPFTTTIPSKNPLLPIPPGTKNSSNPFSACRDQLGTSPVSSTYLWSKSSEKTTVPTRVPDRICNYKPSKYSTEESWNSKSDLIPHHNAKIKRAASKCNESIGIEENSSFLLKPDLQNVKTDFMGEHPVKTIDATHSRKDSLYTAPNNRFNAMLNDKTERTKYFESKKVKDNEPRTYKEFREAKAKAQEIAKKALIYNRETSAAGLNKTELIGNTSQKLQSVDSKKVVVTEKGNTVGVNKKPILENKQNSTEKSSGTSAKGENAAVTPTPCPVETTLDKMYRTQNFSKAEIAIDKKKFKIPKKISKDLPKEDTKTMKKIEESKATEEKLSHKSKIYKKKSVENSTTKKCSPERSRGGATLMEENKNISQKSFDNKRNTSKMLLAECEGNIAIKDPKNNEETTDQRNVIETEHLRDPRLAIANEKKVNESGDISDAEENNTRTNATFENEKINFKFSRILQRRCSMITYASAPEVDKQKLMRANALLFEDLKEEEQRQKRNEITKNELRRSRNLEGIFQKTDDNCTVSAQNIITGKRRTRATINFNEIQNVKAIFKYKTFVNNKKGTTVGEMEELKSVPNVKDAPAKMSSTEPQPEPEPERFVKETEEVNVKIKTENKGGKSSKDAALSASRSAKCKSPSTIEEAKVNFGKVGNPSIKSLEPPPAPTNDSQVKAVNEVENQNNAVSSTSTEMTIERTKLNTSRNDQEELDDNEPSSSGNKSSRSTPLPTEDDINRHAFLNQFIQEIFKPNADKEHILNLLSQILDRDKFEFVKTVIEFATNGNEVKNIAQHENIIDEEKQISVEEESKPINVKPPNDSENEDNNFEISPAKRKSGKKKRNELDRLNDDIRDMFISKGVLTATGKRMCTLMAQSKEKESNLESYSLLNKPASGKEVIQDMHHKTTSKKRVLKKKDESKAKPLRRSLRHGKNATSPPNISDDEMEVTLCAQNASSDEEANLKDAKVTQQEAGARRRQMPVLKPNSPIKFHEEGELYKKGDLKLSKSKRSPKCQTSLGSDVKGANVSPKLCKAGGSTISKDHEAKIHSQIEEITNHLEHINNTNVNWHNQSKYVNWCMICQKKLPTNSSLHYRLHHGENYVSRFAPIILQKFKQGKLHSPLFGVRKADKPCTWFYRCPFCLQYFISPITQWIAHFQEHTAEYRYECSRCYRGGPKITTVRRHCNDKCSGAKVINAPLQITQTNVVKAHVCHLCNFVQLKRSNLERHYLHQHHFDNKTVDLLGYTITLINVEDVVCVDEEEAAVKEAQAWKIINDEEQIIDVDEDNPKQTIEDNADMVGREVFQNSAPDDVDLPHSIDLNLDEIEKYNEQDLQDELLTLAAKAAEVVQKMTENSSDAPSTTNNVIQCEEEQQLSGKNEDAQNAVVGVATADVTHIEKEKESKIQSCESTTAMDAKIVCCESKEEASPNGEKSFQTAEPTATRKGNEMHESSVLATSTQNVFVASRDFSNSPTIDPNCLTQNFMEVEQCKQAAKFCQNTGTGNISIAERISQHFKTIENVSHTSKASQESPNIEIHNSHTNYAPDSNLNESISVANTEDDADWEDIEIIETAPATQHSPLVPSKINKNKGLFQKFMFKSQKTKKTSQPLLYFGKKKTKDKPNSCNSPSATLASTSHMEAQRQAPLTIENESVSSNCSSLGFKPVINIIDDLLPDSPCNDPLELVPELAPLEPLQDLNDISSILNADLSSNHQQLDAHLCGNSMDNQTSIEDALDFVHEQQAQEVEKQKQLILPNVTTRTTIKRIQHVGFSMISGAAQENTFKFYCLLDNCTFLFSSDSIGLENHFLMEHTQTKWNGFCAICQNQIINNDQELSITKEIKHMMEKHAKSEQREENQVVSKECPNNCSDNNEESDEKPRIKLRRLTGDCLSATTIDVSNAIDADSAANSESMLGALLNAKPRPPIKQVVPPLTELLVTKAKPVINSNTCSLKISEVVSLRDPTISANRVSAIMDNFDNSANIPQVPKILNVCSLNKTESDWSQNNTPDAQCQLENASATLRKFQMQLATKRKSASPEPIVVSETVPMAQARSGDFVITQSISAQYEGQEAQGPELGINISILSATPLQPMLAMQSETTSYISLKQFKCMAKGCKYSTRVPVAMSDHLRFHERRNLSLYRDYLNCAFCLNSFENVDDYMTHTEQTHFAGKTNSASSQTTSKLRCMVEECNYSTDVPVNMDDHLRFHEKNHPSTKYLTCSICLHTTTNVDAYMEHVGYNHFSLRKELCAEGSAVNKKPQPVARNQTSNKCAKNSALLVEKSIENDEEVYYRKLSEVIEELVGPTGLPDTKLYRCVVKSCITPLNEASFNQHVMFHTSTLGLSGKDVKFYYKCPHCNIQYQRPATLKAHIKVHARCRYFCYLCNHATSNLGAMLKHFNEAHWHTLNIYTTLLLNLTYKDGRRKELSPETSFHIAYTEHLEESTARAFGKKLIFNWKLKKATTKTHFTSADMDMLPSQPIFPREINCGECEYRTKVRTNLYRHLQMHKQMAGRADKAGVTLGLSSVDPVNPVPCLNTNERFFDKMTNLASSSVVTPYNQVGAATSSLTNAANKKPAVKMPYAFVVESKRYVCGVVGCNYVAISDDLYRSHITTLHDNNMLFRCPFCKEDICKRGVSTERIFAHFKFHGAVLYRCEDCNYLHYLRFLVERHINEKHCTQKVNIIKHERLREEDTEGTCTTIVFTGQKYKDVPEQLVAANCLASDNSNSQAKAKGRWVCSVCGQKSITLNQIQSHCFNEHGYKHQYQCVHCTFGSQQLSQILHHIDEQHNGKARESRNIYYRTSNGKDECNAIDTRPLWQRNDPTRVRHIRGILMEDEEESERNRQKFGLSEEDDDEVDKQLHPNVTKDDSTVQAQPPLSAYEFGCYYCSYKSANFDDLKLVHWVQRHNASDDNAKPFYFRLLRRFRCAECFEFTGVWSELKLHLQTEHNTRYYAAALQMTDTGTIQDKFACGYCSFMTDSSSQLLKHFQRKGHQPDDICIENNKEIEKILKLGVPEKYVQCSVCREIFANRIIIVSHASECHADVEGFSFRDLCNVPIYQCAMCPYTDLSEVNTARHMCDHFARFKICHFCNQAQSSFNAYMQHCYGEHRQGIRKFRDLCTFADIKKFLLQLYVLLPNGLIINKRNLLNCEYGALDFIRVVYEDLCKTSQQPPIPRLSLGRLVAKIGQETKMPQPRSIGKRRCTIAVDYNERKPVWLLPKPPSPLPTPPSIYHSKQKSALVQCTQATPNAPILEPQKISTRRCTVAVDEREQMCASPLYPVSKFPVPSGASLLRNIIESQKISKRRNTTSVEDMIQSCDSDSSSSLLLVEKMACSKKRKVSYTCSNSSDNLDMQPFSFYGQTPEEVDLTKIYTKAAIGGLDAPLTIDKFKLLFNLDARVVLPKYDRGYSDYKHVKKACPASEKYRFN